MISFDPCLRVHLPIVFIGIGWRRLESSGWHGLPNFVVEAFGSPVATIWRVIRRVLLEADAIGPLSSSLVDLLLRDVVPHVSPLAAVSFEAMDVDTKL